MSFSAIVSELGEIRFVIGSLVHFGWNFRTKNFCCVLKISGAKWWTMMVDDRSFCVALASAWCLWRDLYYFSSGLHRGTSHEIHLLCELWGWGWPIDLLFYMLHGASNVTTDSRQHTRGAGLLAGALYSSIRDYYFIRSRSLPSNPSDGALYTTYTLSVDSVGHVPPPPRSGSSSLLIRRSRAIQINSLSSIFNDGQHC